jgi:transposase-like protein
MDMFLQALKDRGLDVQVAITDGSPLYKDSLQSYWKAVEHQRCIFHVIKEVNKLILDGVRAIKTRSNAKVTKAVRNVGGGPAREPSSNASVAKG